MRVYFLFFLIAVCGAATAQTTTTSTSATASISASTSSATSAASSAGSSMVSAAKNMTIGKILSKMNSTASSMLLGKHNIITKGVELGNLTAQSLFGLGAHAMGNATEMAHKGIDVAINMGLQSMKVGRQVTNKTMELLNTLPGSRFIPTNMISNATSMGIGLGERGLNASLSAVKKGIKMGNNIGQTVVNKTGSVVSSIHNQVVKGHMKATNIAMGAVNGTISSISNGIKNVGGWISKVGSRMNVSASMSG